jgi:hypothetical protein
MAIDTRSTAGKIARKVAQHLVTVSGWVPGGGSTPGSTVAIAALLGAVGGLIADPSHPWRSGTVGLVQAFASQWVAERSSSHFDLESVLTRSRSWIALTASGPSGRPQTIEGRGFLAAGMTGAVIGLGQALFRGGRGAGNILLAIRGAVAGFVESTVTTVLAQNIQSLGSVQPSGRASVCGKWIPNGSTTWTQIVDAPNPPPEVTTDHEGYLEAMGPDQRRRFGDGVLAARAQLDAFLKTHGIVVDLEKRVGPIYLSRGQDRAGPFSRFNRTGRSAPSDHRVQVNCAAGEQKPIDPKDPASQAWQWCRVNYDWGTRETPEMTQWAMVAAMLPAAVAKVELEWDGKVVKFRKGLAEYIVRGRKLTEAEDQREKHMRRFNLGTFEYLAWVATGSKVPLPASEYKMWKRTHDLAEAITRAEGHERLHGFHSALLQTAVQGRIEPLVDFFCAGVSDSDTRRATVRTLLLGGDFVEAYAAAREVEATAS